MLRRLVTACRKSVRSAVRLPDAPAFADLSALRFTRDVLRETLARLRVDL